MEKPYVVGIDIGGTNTVFGVVDARGTILYSGAIKTGKYAEIDDYVKKEIIVYGRVPLMTVQNCVVKSAHR